MTNLASPLNNVSKVALNTSKSTITAKNCLRSIVQKTSHFFYGALWSMGQWGPVACYATATRVSHCNKLLSMNLLFLIIFNKFIKTVLQRANFGVLTRKCLFAV